MKQIKYLFLFLILCIITTSCQQKFNLSANIEQLGNDTIIVEYAPVSMLYKVEEPITDTIISENNIFTFNSPLNEPIVAYIFPLKGAVKQQDGTSYHPLQKYLVLEIAPNDEITVTGKLHDKYLAYETQGSEFNETISQIRGTYIENIAPSTDIELQLLSLSKNKGDSLLIDSLLIERIQLYDIAHAKHLEYIKNNPEKNLSAFYLSQLSPDTLTKYYNTVSEQLTNEAFKELLKNRLEQLKINE